MWQMALVKNLRSSFFVKPASWETLLRRTSTSRRTPAVCSFVKNVSADFLVKPMVNIFIRRHPLPAHQVRIQEECKRYGLPEVYRRLSACRPENETYRSRVGRADASDAYSTVPGFQDARQRECAARPNRLRPNVEPRAVFGGIPVVPFRRT